MTNKQIQKIKEDFMSWYTFSSVFKPTDKAIDRKLEQSLLQLQKDTEERVDEMEHKVNTAIHTKKDGMWWERSVLQLLSWLAFSP